MNVRAHASPNIPPQPARRKRRLRHRRLRRVRAQTESVSVEPGGMVDIAVRELGAVIVSVLPADEEVKATGEPESRGEVTALL
jgi:hypothetical protein